MLTRKPFKRLAQCAATLALLSQMPHAAALDNNARSQAASSTAQHARACTDMGDFYWEIGDGKGALASGQSGSAYTADRTIQIASASKFVWGAYVVQREAANGGNLSPALIQGLEMRSGYTGFNPVFCYFSRTVGSCLNNRGNSRQSASDVGRFSYGGGHDQKMAVDLGLGDMSADELTREVRRVVGPELGFDYARPQLAGGMESSPAQFAQFLRKVINGQLVFKQYLGYQPVCTLPSRCSAAASSPVSEEWHYSLNHWVEDDPNTGDGAFSSPGLEGFYPWISADKTTYGIVARQKLGLRAYWESVQCGRTIRKAWITGQTQS